MGLESQQALCLGWRASRGRGRGCEPLSGGSWRSPLAEAQGGGGGGWVDTRGACRARGLDQARGLVSRPGEGEVGGASAAGSTQQDALGGGGGRRGLWRGPESRLQTLLRGQAGDEPGSGGGSGEGGRCI